MPTELMRRIAKVPGAADVRLQQSSHYPEFAIDVDRTRAGELGITERDVTNSLVVNLAGSFQVAPAFWLNPQTGVSYPIVAQTPQYRHGFAVASWKTSRSPAASPATARCWAASAPSIARTAMRWCRITPSSRPSTSMPPPRIATWARVAGDIQKVLDAAAKRAAAKGATVTMRGQVETMNTAFSGLFFGLAEAIVLIYLLIVVNFQSWTDPFVIITALPAALAGIVWMLFATHTTLSVPALTGAIMCMGVATANSILVVSFAREQLDATGDAVKAALEAGVTRFRPVLMTALAMIIGMAPMALGLGEGGEQNAPLGRAVIGGLIVRHLRHPVLRARRLQPRPWRQERRLRHNPTRTKQLQPEKPMPR